MPGIHLDFKFKTKDNLQSFKAALHRKLDTAFEALSDESVTWVRDKMLHVYHDPHVADGHTEIYDTGALIDSIEAQVDTKLFLFHKLDVGSPLDYASYVHNGTRKLKGRPFIRDAIEEHQNEFVDVIKQAIQDL